MAQLIAEDRLGDAAYVSPAGPVTPHDMLYGFGPQMAQGYLFMAHRSGFTRKTLMEALQQAGFGGVGARRTRLDLWVVAINGHLPGEGIQSLMADHLP